MTTDDSPGDNTADDDSAPVEDAAPEPVQPEPVPAVEPAELEPVGAAPAMAAGRRSRRRGRTWPQRLVLAMNIVLVIGCLVAATALFVSQKNLEDVQRVDALPTPDELAPPPSLVVETLLD